uniref:Uncharacterized protein n=1 Tax=Pseudo-nitzschia australis TaxID=44445 RepID=A0A7S4EHH2_9STRA
MDCYTAGSRLRTINDTSVYLPNSGGAKLFPLASALKAAVYDIMLPKWQLKFDASNVTTDDLSLTLKCLVAFMEQQHLHHDAVQQNCRHQQLFGHNNQLNSYHQQSFGGNQWYLP